LDRVYFVLWTECTKYTRGRQAPNVAWRKRGWPNAETKLNLPRYFKHTDRYLEKPKLFCGKITYFSSLCEKRNPVIENNHTVEVQFMPIDVDKVITYLPPLSSWACNGSLREVCFTVSSMGMMTLFSELVMFRRTNTPIKGTITGPTNRLSSEDLTVLRTLLYSFPDQATARRALGIRNLWGFAYPPAPAPTGGKCQIYSGTSEQGTASLMTQ